MAWGGGTIIPSKEDIVIPAFTNTELTVKGDADLKPENIKNGINVFGVTGNMPVHKITFGETYLEGTYSEETYKIVHGLNSAPTHYGVNGEFRSITSTTGNPNPTIYVDADATYIKVTVPRIRDCNLRWVAVSKEG